MDPVEQKEWAEGLLRTLGVDLEPNAWTNEAEEVRTTARGLSIATVTARVQFEHVEALSRLIAAAPDLAAAVISLAGEVERLRAGGDALGEWAQSMRSKGDGAKVIDLLRAIDDWMLVCHEQESRIEQLEDAALSPHPSEPEDQK